MFASVVLPFFRGAVWLPTPRKDIEGMLAAAELKEGDLLVDLGCGDGRTLILGARLFGARGLGVEIDPLKVMLARFFIRRAGLSRRIDIRRGDIAKTDVSQADVVFLYMSHQALDEVAPLLRRQLKPGARIASYGFMLSGLPVWKVYGPKKGFIYRAGVGERVDGIS